MCLFFSFHDKQELTFKKCEAKIILFLFLFALMASSSMAQEKDSAQISAVKEGFYLANENPDSAYKIGIKGLQYANHSGSDRLKAFSFKTKGWALLRLGNYDSASADLLRSAAVFRQLKDIMELSYVYFNLAIAYSNHSEFEKSTVLLNLLTSCEFPCSVGDAFTAHNVYCQSAFRHVFKKTAGISQGVILTSLDNYFSFTPCCYI